MTVYKLSTAEPITLDTMCSPHFFDYHLELTTECIEKVNSSFEFLHNTIKESTQAFYGINTGFGALCNTVIASDDLSLLQRNLILSHACGAGERVPNPIVRLMLFLKIRSLAYGYSAISVPVLMRLVEYYNQKVYPVVYTQGSLGASGDLAPLAHLCLPLIDEGRVVLNNEEIHARELNHNRPPISLHPKEGLALLNGTQFMSAYGVYILLELRKLIPQADTIAALSLDAFNASTEPFDERIHKIRPHDGQIHTAALIWALRKDSEIAQLPKKQVQDPYSFRCIPQVHGAVKDGIKFIESVFEKEINSVSDNPNVFVPEIKAGTVGAILSGGNFHGQILAGALDYLAILMTQLGGISERRCFQLLSGTRGLPAFLANNPGLHSGLMIAQYTAAGIVNENKTLAHPNSVDSIVSSNGQEDFVSMGANAAVKAYRILENLKTLLAIELIHASRALYFREPLKTGSVLFDWLNSFRKIDPVGEPDHIISRDIRVAKQFLATVEAPLAATYNYN
jgi:histidine ammonia-lyase